VTLTDPAAAEPQWREPWRTGGMWAVARNPRLVWELVRGDLRSKYQSTILGDVWGYIKPLTRFMVYFLVIGVLLGISKKVDNFPVYIFCGVVVVQFFNAALNSGTKALAKYLPLVKRVNIPREAIPVSTVLANIFRLRPSLIILVIAAVLTGWRPIHLVSLPYAVAGLLLVTVFVSGLVLVSSVANLYIRDTQYAVETAVMVVSWASPVIYPWTLVADKYGEHSWITTVYLSNPITIAVFGVRATFWEPTVTDPLPAPPPLPFFLAWVIALATFAVGLRVMQRYDHSLILRSHWGN
jgi:ABC-2 type transport system permease protein